MHEFVPEVYKGKLKHIDRLLHIMRSIYSMVPCPLDYPNSLLKLISIWASGDRRLCSDIAKLLLNNIETGSHMEHFVFGENSLAAIHVDIERNFTPLNTTTASQIVSALLPGMMLGIVDAGLHITMQYAQSRHLYGKTVMDLPSTRSILVNVFADLLLCESLATVVARSIHVLPGSWRLYPFAVKQLISKTLTAAMSRLATILGARFYLRSGEYSTFHKLFSNLNLLVSQHVSPLSCHLITLPNLPFLAKELWVTDNFNLPIELFDLLADMTSVCFDKLALQKVEDDTLILALVNCRKKIVEIKKESCKKILYFIDIFLEELNNLKYECKNLRLHDLTIMASSSVYDLTTKYAILIAASSCINIWSHNQDKNSIFSNDDTLILFILNRILSFLGKKTITLSDQIESRFFKKLWERYEGSYGFALSNNQIFA